MHKEYRIKMYRKNVKSNNRKCFFIVVAFNDAKESGGFIDRIGFFSCDEKGQKIYGLDLAKLGY